MEANFNRRDHGNSLHHFGVVQRRSRDLLPETLIVQDPEQAANVLIALGLPPLPAIEEALAVGLEYRRECTTNDPPYLPGVISQAKTHGILADRLSPENWVSLCDPLPRLFNPKTNVSLAVLTSDLSICDNEAAPRSKHKRGPASHRAVFMNSQPSLFDDPRFGTVEGPRERPVLYWLLIHSTHEEVFSQIIEATYIEGARTFTGLRKRIILPKVVLNIPMPESRYDEGPDFEVPVERRVDL